MRTEIRLYEVAMKFLILKPRPADHWGRVWWGQRRPEMGGGDRMGNYQGIWETPKVGVL